MAPPPLPPPAPPTPPGGTTLQQHFENDGKVAPAKRNVYIVMVASEAVPGFDVNKTHPYPKFKDLKGYKSLFKQSKEMIYQEARRRDPSVSMNANNRSNEDMVGDLATKLGHLLTLEDKEFIAKKESEMRAILISLLLALRGTYSSLKDPKIVQLGRSWMRVCRPKQSCMLDWWILSTIRATLL